MKSKPKRPWEGVTMLIQTFVLKIINNEGKILTHHETINCTVEKIVSLEKRDHTKVQGNKIVDSPKLTEPNYSHLLI